MKITRLALSLCLVLPVLVAEAEVYRYVDKNGNHVFTDRSEERRVGKECLP